MKSLKNLKKTKPMFMQYLEDEEIEIIQLIEVDSDFLLLLSNCGGSFYMIGAIDKNAFDDTTVMSNFEIIDSDEKYCDPTNDESETLENYSNRRFISEIAGFCF